MKLSPENNKWTFSPEFILIETLAARQTDDRYVESVPNRSSERKMLINLEEYRGIWDKLLEKMHPFKIYVNLKRDTL